MTVVIIWSISSFLKYEGLHKVEMTIDIVTKDYEIFCSVIHIEVAIFTVDYSFTVLVNQEMSYSMDGGFFNTMIYALVSVYMLMSSELLQL